ncbi:MAG: proteasome accessory factor PafA2 family protein, partial [Actinobacteria bacterium]|nr:proteasome accessory factor PafA2 family protein [Actinomycetota bacterium]
RSRPIINTRDEPHADAEKYRRLHVIVGDSSMSEYTSWIKIATTAVLLRMLEEGVVMRDLSLENPIRAIREISHDTTCRRKVRLANGREASAIELQWEYLKKASDYVDRRDDPEMKEAVRAWEECLVCLEDDFSKLNTKIDWIMKYHVLQDYRNKHGLSLSHPKMALMDLAYHDVSRRRGLYYLLERSGLAERYVTDEEIDTAKLEPPQTTRAKLRGEFIKTAKRRRRDFTVDWVHLKLNDQAQRTLLCKDPFKHTDERVERLIASL